jgi:tight adherence protein B
MPGGVLIIAAVGLVGVAALVMALAGTGAGTAKAAGAQARADARAQWGDGAGADRAPLLTRLLSATGLQASMQQTLLAAGLLVRPSELAAVSVAASALAFGLVLVLRHSVVLAVLAGVGAVLLPTLAVNHRVGSRRREFQHRLPEALELIASALRSGYTFSRCLQLVSREMRGPMGDEAQRFTDELAVGIPTEEALDRLTERQPSYDVKLFAAAVQMQARVGGNLAEILLKTGAMVRERYQLQSEIRALTAEGRLSAAILAAIPIFLAIVVSVISPGYLTPMMEEPLGRYMVVGGVMLWLTGLGAIRKLVTLDI